jgi:hypothetical protein
MRSPWLNGSPSALLYHQSFWYVPSQNGGIFVCFHWYKAASFRSDNGASPSLQLPQ